MNKTHDKRKYILFPLLFLIVVCVGLYIVKWNPYYGKAFIAAAKGSIGSSILTAGQSAPPPVGWEAAIAYAKVYFDAVWKAVILGLLLGSLVQVLIPRIWVARILGGNSLKDILFATASALPGMMCTCCTAPVAVGLRKAGAAIGPAIAFFLGNPVLNPATLIFMGFVLGWEFSIFRIIMGLILVIGTAYCASKFFPQETVSDMQILEKESTMDNQEHWFTSWMRALKDLIIDTIPAYLIVVFILGAVRAWLFPSIDPATADSLLLVIAFAFAGALFVIPTAAEIPIVQALLVLGLGIGPSISLLMTLPALSIVSLLLVRRVFPSKILVYLYASVVVVGIISGLIAPMVLG